jgi:serine/threonine protein kinase/tetratricopeptide (TPR) repeat protein
MMGRTADPLSMDDKLHIDQVCLGFEAAWKQADVPPSLDACLQGVGEPERSELLRQLLLLDLDYRLRRGQVLGREDYCRLFPRHGQTIDEAFRAAGLSLIESSQDTMKRCLGDYELLEEIGRGGMGIVYKAEQVSLRRRVALKVLPFAAALDERQLQRFRNEAQAAAQLHHTHIVPVFSIGCERGVHYYAMQYIEGRPLTEVIRELHCLADRKSTDERPGDRPVSAVTSGLASGRWLPAEPQAPGSSVAALARSGNSTGSDGGSGPGELSSSSPPRGGAFFRSAADLGLQAAEALHHAHDAGIVHRDIKPSNLLLDVRGHLWITDFGLALVQTDATLTMAGDLLGTIRYMSPEQALARRVPLDHRTDIYSLGVTMYELLALRPAFPGRDRQELLHQIAFEDPRPLRKVNPRIPRELATIVGKAVAKSPSERYSTAQDMADDLRRFLEDKPIQARPPTVMDRVTKWARRHRPLAVSAAVLLVLAVVGLTVSTVLVAREQRRTEAALTRAQIGFQAADAQQARAEANYERARQAVEQMTRLAEEQLAHTPRMVEVRGALLEESLQFYQGFLQERGKDPAVRYEAARAYTRAGEINALLGRGKQAEASYTQAITIFGQLTADFPKEPGYRVELAKSCGLLGKFRWTQARAQEGEAPCRRALTIWEALITEFPDHPDYRSRSGIVLNDLGIIMAETGRGEEAERYYRQSLAVLEELSAGFPDQPEYRSELARAHNNLGIGLTGAQKESAFRQAVALQEKLAAEFPADPKYKESLALYLRNLGDTLRGSGRSQEAEELYPRAVALQEELTSDFPSVPRYWQRLLQTRQGLAQLLSDQKRLEEAEKMYRQALVTLEKLSAEFPSVPEYRDKAAASYQMLGELRRLEPVVGPPKAEASVRRAIALREELAAAFPARPSYRAGLAESYRSLGGVLLKLQQYQSAEEAGRQSVDMYAALAAEFPETSWYRNEQAMTLRSVAAALKAAQKYQEAEAAYRQSVDMCAALAAEFPRVAGYRHEHAWGWCILGDTLMRSQRYQEAEAAFRQSLPIWQGLIGEFPDAPPDLYRGALASCYKRLGWALEGLQRHREAEQALRQCLQMRRALAAETRTADFRRGVSYARFMLDLLLRRHGRAAEVADEQPEEWEPWKGLHGLKVERLPLTARRLDQVRIDGSLDEWAGVSPHVTADQERVRDYPQAWTGPEDCSFTTRIAYDAENLYLAIDVTDDKLVPPYGEFFYHDGIEVFWDPRDPRTGDPAFGGPCRQLQIPLPAAGQPMRGSVPHDSGCAYTTLDWTQGRYRSPTSLASAIGAAWRPRDGGYVVELAIPFEAIGEQFTPSPGAVLPLTVMVSDRDDEAKDAPTSCLVLSGHSHANWDTSTYALITFQ